MEVEKTPGSKKLLGRARDLANDVTDFFREKGLIDSSRDAISKPDSNSPKITLVDVMKWQEKFVDGVHGILRNPLGEEGFLRKFEGAMSWYHRSYEPS